MPPLNLILCPLNLNFVPPQLGFCAPSTRELFQHRRVAEVTADKVTVVDKKTKEKKQLPYGVCVWSTGIAATPLTEAFMASVPEQGKG